MYLIYDVGVQLKRILSELEGVSPNPFHLYILESSFYCGRKRHTTGPTPKHSIDVKFIDLFLKANAESHCCHTVYSFDLLGQ